MCALNVRAYTAAYVIWLAVEHLQRDAVTLGTSSSFFFSYLGIFFSVFRIARLQSLFSNFRSTGKEDATRKCAHCGSIPDRESGR